VPHTHVLAEPEGSHIAPCLDHVPRLACQNCNLPAREVNLTSTTGLPEALHLLTAVCKANRPNVGQSVRTPAQPFSQVRFQFRFVLQAYDSTASRSFDPPLRAGDRRDHTNTLFARPHGIGVCGKGQRSITGKPLPEPALFAHRNN